MNGNGIHPLREGVEKFVQRDGKLGIESLVEIVPLEDLAHGVAGSKFDDIGKRHRIQPRGIIHHFELLSIEYFAHLLDVRGGVSFHIFFREHGPRFLTAGGIANHRCEIADDERGLMAHILNAREAYATPRRGRCEDRGLRICAKLDDERLARRTRAFYFLRKFLLVDEIDGAAPRGIHLFVQRWESHFGNDNE